MKLNVIKLYLDGNKKYRSEMWLKKIIIEFSVINLKMGMNMFIDMIESVVREYAILAFGVFK